MTKKSVFIGSFCVLFLLANLPFMTAYAAQKESLSLPKSIKLSVGPDGSMTYGYGLAVADVIQRFLGITVAVTPSAGTQAVMETINVHETDLAVVSSMHAQVGLVGAFGYQGFTAYKKWGPIPVRTLVMGTPMPMGLVVRRDINKPANLKGKKIFGNNLGSSGNLQQTKGVLALAGLSTDDVTILNMSSNTEGLRWLAEGKADAYVGGISGAAAREFEARSGGKYKVLSIPIDPASMKIFNKYYPGSAGYTAKTDEIMMPKGTTTWASFSFLGSGAYVDENLIYAVTKGIFERTAELTAIRKALATWNIDTTVSVDAFTPFHPGAIKYLKERKVWTEALQKQQEEMLSLESQAKANR